MSLHSTPMPSAGNPREDFTTLIRSIRKVLNTADLQPQSKKNEPKLPAEFMSSAMMDISDPVRRIAMFLDLLEKSEGANFGTRSRSTMEIIRRNIDYLGTILKDITEYIGNANITPGKKRIDLNALFETLRSHRQQALQSLNAVMHINDLPIITGDEEHFIKLFDILLGNAILYHDPKAPPEITVTGNQNAEMVQITISDNGIGFDPDKCEMIFNPLTRLWAKDDYPGSGMGLAIAELIVNQYGGNIYAESQPGVGSRFMVTLPTGQPHKLIKV